MTPQDATDERAALAAVLLNGLPPQMRAILARYQALLLSWLADQESLSPEELLALAVLDDLAAVFLRAGLTQYFDTVFADTVRRVVPLVRAELAGQGLEASLDIGALTVFVDGRAAAVAAKIAGTAAEAVLDAWAQSTFVGKPLIRATQEAVEAVSDRTIAVARAEITAAFTAIDRLATAQAGIKAGAAFLYIHPRDSVTRASCGVIAGKVYTQEEIAAMDNGQLPDVLLTCGGYNCRGHWSPYLLPVRPPNERGDRGDVAGFNAAARRR